MSVRTFSRSRDGNMQLSPNFKVVEFASRDGSDKILIDTRLVEVLQRIRDWVKRPVNITSGFRSQAHNAAVGGAFRSFHVQGQAADITISGLSPLVIAGWAETALREANIPGGIIVYNTFTHIDVRPTRYRAVDNNGRVTVNNGWPAMPIPSGAPTQSQIPSPNPNSNVPGVINFFLPKGLANAPVAAIVGNLQQESGINIDPAAEQRNGPARGAIQWEGERLERMLNAAKAQNVPWQDLTFQLNFMWNEMRARDLSDRMRGYATTWNDDGAFMRILNSKGAVPLPNGFDDFISMTSVEAATILFEATFFRAGTPRIERRIQFAQAAYDLILQGEQERQEQLESVNFNVRVIGVPLNVRVGPGKNYKEHMQIRQTGIYTVIAEANGPGGDGVWYMIVAGEHGAQSGWISRKHTEEV